ncbi:MAG TPA: succinate dehydrogenase, hydrophobic membrane anchor protein [Woeseiaceae bacterium]|nr:succinate dehydrogenase, hydrophobic membrane anchor protein [Woeseiaceae bacterium]
MDLRTPLARALGHGAAHAGTEHWWSQRLSAVALLLLSAWFLVSMLLLPGFSFDTVQEWMARPWNGMLMFLLAATTAWHSSLGLQVVIEDYVHQPFVRVVSLILSKFIHALLAVVALFAVVILVLGADS